MRKYVRIVAYLEEKEWALAGYGSAQFVSRFEWGMKLKRPTSPNGGLHLLFTPLLLLREGQFRRVAPCLRARRT